ncbi:MAG: serine hydrolase, partial [Microlunatus sp.]|nr:serine hydrolase [Microlunatus sp.]
IQRQTGETLTEYLRPRLFDPLGIGRVGWQQYPPRRDLGFTGLHATTAAVAKLGQLYLQRGWWGDRQLLPVAWVEEATRVQVKNPLESNPDWSQGYGFQFWMARHGFRGDGAYGQFCVVLPEYDVVVAITGASHDTQAVLDGLWTHLLPALSDNHRGSPDRTAAELRLSRRMTSCELVAPAGSREPEVDGSRWDGAVFAAAGGRCGDQPTLESVRLDRVGGEWQVSLVEATTRVTGLLGNDGWHVTENADGTADRPLPIAVSGGWVEGSLGFEVLFFETPHRLRVVCSVTDGTFAASWLTVPLRSGSLLDLRMPG